MYLWNYCINALWNNCIITEKGLFCNFFTPYIFASGKTDTLATRKRFTLLRRAHDSCILPLWYQVSSEHALMDSEGPSLHLHQHRVLLLPGDGEIHPHQTFINLANLFFVVLSSY